MNIFIMNCHTANRGDEAAVRALVDELISLYPDIEITLGMRGATRYPNLPQNVKSIDQIIVTDSKDLKFNFLKYTKGRVALGKTFSTFMQAVKRADLILHAPGGPSIGDTYYDAEMSYLNIYDLLISLNKPYMFYAPSMGPFKKSERNELRKRILKNSKAIVLRDPISAQYVRGFLPDEKIYQTLDSALQHDINFRENENKLNNYSELNVFLKNHPKCIGVTITDLMWHPIYSKDDKIKANIQKTFDDMLSYLTHNGFGIIFVPQLYGAGNDYNLMKSFCKNESDYFIIPDNNDEYDTYFQQYLISKLYAVIGMRYHSNIFSAKMETPFISVSYEQKMQGFMEKMGLSNYCIKVSDLSIDTLKMKFIDLQQNYDSYKKLLEDKHMDMKNESYKTTEIVKRILEK